MMKNKIIIAIVFIFLVGTITFIIADISNNNITKTDTARLTALKESVKLTEKDNLVIQYGKINCNEIDCWSSVDYPNIINTEWRFPKNYCSLYNYTYNENGDITNSECIKFVDYTNYELITMRDEWVKMRLEQYADKLITDKNKPANEVKVNEGTLTINDK